MYALLDIVKFVIIKLYNVKIMYLKVVIFVKNQFMKIANVV